MRCVSIVRSVYFRKFSSPFCMTFLSSEITTYPNMHVSLSLSRVLKSGLWLGILLLLLLLLLLLFLSSIRHSDASIRL